MQNYGPKETILKRWEKTILMVGMELLAETENNADVEEELFLRNGIEELMLESSERSHDGEVTQNGDDFEENVADDMEFVENRSMDDIFLVPADDIVSVPADDIVLVSIDLFFNLLSL